MNPIEAADVIDVHNTHQAYILYRDLTIRYKMSTLMGYVRQSAS